MKKLYKINEPKALAIPIKDNGEPLVTVSKLYPQLFYDKARKNVYRYAQSQCRLRKSVAERLVLAQQYLPKGIVFKIKEGYRSKATQRRLFEWHLDKLRKKYPNKTETFLKEKAVEWVAPPGDAPPHTTGGAVDLTLMTSGKKELDMGQWIHDGRPESITYAKNISSKARKNRQILIKTMTKAGFVNYPYEWWHWSYGDRFWAFLSKKKYSIYKGK